MTQDPSKFILPSQFNSDEEQPLVYVPNHLLGQELQPYSSFIYQPTYRFPTEFIATQFRLRPYREVEDLLAEVETLYPRRVDTKDNTYVELPLGNPTDPALGMGYPRFSTGNSPPLGLVQVPNRKRFSNPYKRPCLHSTTAPLAISQHYKSNSTSCVWTTNTVVQPRVGELMNGTAVHLHSQLILSTLCSTGVRYQSMPIFDETSYTKQPPPPPTLSIDSILAFIKNVFEVGQFHPETCLITLIYVNRFLSRTSIQFTTNNWKPIFIVALIIAQKSWDDTPLINSDFNILYPPLTITSINQLERCMLDYLEFDLVVTQSQYASYFFDLRLSLEQARNPVIFVGNKSIGTGSEANAPLKVGEDPSKTSLVPAPSISHPASSLPVSPSGGGIASLGPPGSVLVEIHNTILRARKGCRPHSFIDRASSQRIHLSEYYTRRKVEYKKMVMTPELIEVTEKYRILS